VFKHYRLLAAIWLFSSPAIAELRDPTLPGNLPHAEVFSLASGETIFNLSSIWIAGNNRHAVINGISVSPGQTLPDGSRVLKILPHYVLVNQKGGNKKIYLVPSVKNPVK
jgi:hypothetical protein